MSSWREFQDGLGNCHDAGEHGRRFWREFVINGKATPQFRRGRSYFASSASISDRHPF
jgi:hypothetical protein